MVEEKKDTQQKIRHDVVYDKFLMIEGWAYRGKMLIERDNEGKAKEAALRVREELKILLVSLKLEG
jgi:hypothetical protein